MLAICIPVYNFDVNPLINALVTEISSFQIPCEIVVIDDCSNAEFRSINAPVEQHVKYVELSKNVGRAKIRNLFLDHTEQEQLLFLDGDSLIISSAFLRTYLDALSPSLPVICGGRTYPEERPSRRQLLRWKYGIQREFKSAIQRSQYPNESFMTNNFLINRELLEKIRFDERLTDYGHEDTLFGIELMRAGITIKHIENPILNGDIETNELFLSKTERAVENLVLLMHHYEFPAELEKEVLLLRTAKKLKSLSGLIYWLHKLTAPVFLFFLKRGVVSLACFSFYKLGYFTIKNKSFISIPVGRAEIH